MTKGTRTKFRPIARLYSLDPTGFWEPTNKWVFFCQVKEVFNITFERGGHWIAYRKADE